MRQWYYVYITCANLYSVSYPLCVKHFGRDDWAVVKIEGSFEKIASYKRIYGKSNIILVYGTFCGNNDRDLRVLIGLERGWKNCECCFCGIRIIHGAVWCLIESFEVAFDHSIYVWIGFSQLRRYWQYHWAIFKALGFWQLVIKEKSQL